jgi:hypothetical protein
MDRELAEERREREFDPNEHYPGVDGSNMLP